jgi:hypothetical protein
MFDPMGRQFGGNMPMTSYAGNNALAGVAGKFGGGGWSGLGRPQFRGGAPGLQPPMQPGTSPVHPSVLSSFAPGGMPQQFQDWRQQVGDWRGQRPVRGPGTQRPQFPGWR